MIKTIICLSSLASLLFSEAALSQSKTLQNKDSQTKNSNSTDQKTQNSEILVKIKNHRFEPSEINMQPNQKFTLIIENLDSTLEEFESDDLKKEKLVGAGKKIMIPINALAAGEYKFYGDFHQKTAQGKIIVK